MTTFGEVNQPGSNDRRDGWQKHHVVPTQQHGIPALQPLFDAIKSTNLPADIRYDHNLFDFNGCADQEAREMTARWKPAYRRS